MNRQGASSHGDTTIGGHAFTQHIPTQIQMQTHTRGGMSASPGLCLILFSGLTSTLNKPVFVSWSTHWSDLMAILIALFY